MASFTSRILTFSAVFLFVLEFLPQQALTADSEPSVETPKKSPERNYLRDAPKILKEIKKDYDPRVIPKSNESVEVFLSVGISNLDLDEYTRKFTIQGYRGIYWRDIRLQWDKSKYSLMRVHLPRTEVWVPDIMLYNFADHPEISNNEDMVAVNYNGRVTSYDRVVLSSLCTPEMSKFPYDTHTCIMTYGSWKFSSEELNLTSLYYATYVFGDASNKWFIDDLNGRINREKYECCPDEYVTYKITVHLRRKSSYFSHVIVFPAILIGALVPFTFLLPPETKERITLGIAILVLTFMEINEINNLLPRHHASVPIIITYHVLTVVWVALSLVLSIFILNIYNRGPRRKKMPALLRVIFLRGIRHLVCLGGDTYYTVDEQETSTMRGMGRTNASDTAIAVQDNQATPKLERDTDEIKKQVQSLAQRCIISDARQEIFAEWQQLALVIDRVLLIFFSLTFVISAISIFA